MEVWLPLVYTNGKNWRKFIPTPDPFANACIPFLLCILATGFSVPVVAQSITCVLQEDVWIKSVNSPNEGNSLNVTVERDADIFQQGEALNVTVKLSYTNPISGLNVLENTLPHTYGVTIKANDSTARLSVNGVQNYIVNDAVGIKAEILADSDYCVPDTTSRPASRTTSIADDDSYKQFVELAQGQSSTVTEGEDISVLVKRCVVQEHGDGTSTRCCCPG